jgi:Predicted pPIWI-associating nuclease
VMDAPLGEWQSLCQAFSKVSGRIDRAASVHLNSSEVRAATAQVAQRYLRLVRPLLLESGLNEQASVLDGAFATLLQLTEGRNLLSSYKKQIKRIRKTIPSVTAGLAMQLGASTGSPKDFLSADEQKLLKTLGSMLPTAAMSYRQALTDLADDKRVSFRGPALELREAMREVLDHIAPDKDVMSSTGYKPEKDEHGKDRTKPTMKQKVRFILKQRAEGVGKAALSTAEDTAMTIDVIVGDVTRSVYQLSSVATHVASERTQVTRVKRYVEAVLHDLLEIS